MNWIKFEIQAKQPSTLDEFSFVDLLKMKYDARVGEFGRRQDDEGKFFYIRLDFQDFQVFGDARAHCHAHLDGAGRVKADYIKVLDGNDPGRSAGSALKDQVMQSEVR